MGVQTDGPPRDPAKHAAYEMKWVGIGICAMAGALVVAALLISMASNDGCLPWQQADENRRGATVCK